MAERDLLTVGRAHQQISDLMRAAAELGLHADHQIEQLLSLNDLGDGLPADRGGNHSFDVGNVDAVARNLVAIDVDQKAGLAKFAHYGEFGEAGYLAESVLDLDGFVLKYVQVVTIDFDRQRALEAGERFVHRVFGGLRVVEDNSGKGREFLVDGFDQLFLVADVAGPGLVLVRLESNVELAVKKARGIGAIVGPS